MSLDPRVDLLIRDDYALFERLKPFALKWSWDDLPKFAPRGTLVFENAEKLQEALSQATGMISMSHDKDRNYWWLRATNAERMLRNVLDAPTDEEIRQGSERLLSDVLANGLTL